MKFIHLSALLIGMTLLKLPPTATAAEETAALKSLEGVWLAESVDTSTGSSVAFAWDSIFTVRDGAFTVSHFCGSPRSLAGTFKVDPNDAAAIDVNVGGFDLSDIWTGESFQACDIPAIYKMDGGKLTLCFRTGSDRHQPTEMAAKERDTYLVTFVRANAGFRNFPSEVKVSVRDQAGHAATGASLFSFMGNWPTPNSKTATQPALRYVEMAKTGADGVATIQYEDLSSYAIAAHDERRNLTGFTAPSPSLLQGGTATVTLLPECDIRGTIQCDELAKAGRSVGWTNTYLLADGRRVGMCESKEGTFEFHAPAGNYTFDAYGEQLRGKYVDATVPKGVSEFQVQPISLTASRLTLLEGNPAPELEHVFGWKGQPLKLADLRGKIVLLDFWGYWCGPCVHEMPVLMHLYDRFKDKGLAIIGVHVDGGDEDVDTAAKLDEKLISIKKELWNGRDVPFPVALTSGRPLDLKNGEWQRGGTAAEYGILGYPTTVLINRKGNVVGKIYVNDETQAIDDIAKLLDAKE